MSRCVNDTVGMSLHLTVACFARSYVLAHFDKHGTPEWPRNLDASLRFEVAPTLVNDCGASPELLTVVDRWILSRLARASTSCHSALAEFRMGAAATAVRHPAAASAACKWVC